MSQAWSFMLLKTMMLGEIGGSFPACSLNQSDISHGLSRGGSKSRNARGESS